MDLSWPRLLAHPARRTEVRVDKDVIRSAADRHDTRETPERTNVLRDVADPGLDVVDDGVAAVGVGSHRHCGLKRRVLHAADEIVAELDLVGALDPHEIAKCSIDLAGFRAGPAAVDGVGGLRKREPIDVLLQELDGGRLLGDRRSLGLYFGMVGAKLAPAPGSWPDCPDS
jgi:hypothetical protein